MPLQSVFVTGTDTDVGKTVIAAGIARAARRAGIDVGVMKPFAASDGSAFGQYRSPDTEILARAAGCSEPDLELNPAFSEIPASPYTSSKKSGQKADVQAVMAAYERLALSHEAVVVEGMGGAMTPILRDYFVADLAGQMRLPALIVARNRIGALNHSVLAHMACKDRGVRVAGFVINCTDGDGYDPKVLAEDVADVTGSPVLGIVPPTDVEKAGALENIASLIDTRPLGI